MLAWSASELRSHLRADGYAQVQRKVFDAFVEGELRHTPPFGALPPRALKELVPMLELEEVPASTELFQAGSPGDKLYILLHGKVSLLRGSQLLERLEIEQGGAAALAPLGLPIFGELAMLDRKPRAATAVVTADSKLLVLQLANFGAANLAAPTLKAGLRKLREARRAAAAR